MRTRPAHDLIVVQLRQISFGRKLCPRPDGVPLDGYANLRWTERAIVAAAIDDIRSIRDRKVVENLGQFPIGQDWRRRELRMLDEIRRHRAYHTSLIRWEHPALQVAS